MTNTKRGRPTNASAGRPAARSEVVTVRLDPEAEARLRAFAEYLHIKPTKLAADWLTSVVNRQAKSFMIEQETEE